MALNLLILALDATAVHAGPLIQRRVDVHNVAPITASQAESATTTAKSPSSAEPASGVSAGVVATGEVDANMLEAAVEVNAEDAPPPATACSLVTFSDALLTQTFPGVTLTDETREASTTTMTIAGGPGCECADGTIAGFYRSLGNDGQTTYYCATEGPHSTTAAVSTAVATGTAGDPDN